MTPAGRPTGGIAEARKSRDRLELLTALINGPQFDPLLHGDRIVVPLDHPTLRWNCMVTGCTRPYLGSRDLCHQHLDRWREAQAEGTSLSEFLQTAEPLTSQMYMEAAPCRVAGCARPSRRLPARLCVRHHGRWWKKGCPGKEDYGTRFLAWLAGEEPFDSLGTCVAACCDDLAQSPLGLCADHATSYKADGRPGGARLPDRWFVHYEVQGLPVPVEYDDERAFRAWAAGVLPPHRAGQLNMFGLHPLVKAELKWSIFAHTQRPDRTRWCMASLQALVEACRPVRALDGLDPATVYRHCRLIHHEMLRELRIIYITPSESREAGYIEFDHFGKKVLGVSSEFALSAIPQRWLRDLAWDFLAARLRSTNPARGSSYYHGIRSALEELGAFLEVEAPGGGHDASLLGEEHTQRFAADQHRRARDGLPALRAVFRDRPLKASEVTRKAVFDNVRQVLRWALDSDEADRIGLSRAFIRAFPAGGRPQHRRRSPFPDDVARAVSAEENLRGLAGLDPNDRGLRDIWETIIVTGRRSSEVIKLRLDCVQRYNGVPMLWHDQTKVGNLDEAIRIPERAYERILARQRTTLIRYEHRFGRLPDAGQRTRLALFPAQQRNPRGERPVSYQWFSTGFRTWIQGLDLGRYVAHQARHTLATRLLAAGASMHHIQRFLGHLSQAMAEHYARVALSEIDDVLHHVWVAGPGAGNPGQLISSGITTLSREEAEALAMDLSRRSTPADGGQCTFQVVVDGGACPWKLDCENCDKFVMTGADLLYWRRKREQWQSIAERAPTDEAADYLHKVFEPTARAIDGLESALAALGLLEDALALDLRRPQDYFHRLWSTGFPAARLAAIAQDPDDLPGAS